MRSSSSSTRSSCSRSEPRGRSARLLAALLACAAIAGCGEDDDAGAPSAAGPEPQAEGTLRIAVKGPVETIDPLQTDNRAERLVARQVYEPLVSNESGPFGQGGRRPGLIRSIRPAAGGLVWVAKLRSGVRFGDGELLDADAVIANSSRWLASRTGSALVPGLTAVDSPRPGLVRFILDRPQPRFDRLLADPRLAVVSPAVIAAAGAEGIRMNADGGTGPFEVRESDADGMLLARRASWWGARLGLGPGLDQVELLEVADRRDRADGLRQGAVEVADGLRGRSASVVRADPLLAIVGGQGAAIGVERSVRGIETAADDQSLADVWLTDLR